MAEVIAVQHTELEPLGLIAEALERAGHSWRYIRPFADEPVPHELGSAAGLVLMGGPMNVSDAGRYAYLRDEMRLIEAALRRERPVLGICLGAQLLAHVLGASVTPAQQAEVGWFEVTFEPEAREDPMWGFVAAPFMAFHWHLESFTLPAGAIALARSVRTPFQGFRYGRAAYGIQFHPEVTAAMVEALAMRSRRWLERRELSPEDLIRGAEHYLGRSSEIGLEAFSRWAEML